MERRGEGERRGREEKVRERRWKMKGEGQSLRRADNERRRVGRGMEERRGKGERRG